LIKSQTKNFKRIFIDEVQRIPSVLNTIQAIIDNDKTKQFYLTGSSARKLKRGQANLLPGRILSYELGPLTHQELADNFELARALSRGLLPGIYNEKSEQAAEKLLKTYAATYLKEEVQAEALTRNLEGFSRYFQIMASRSGDFTDFSKFASAAMIERTTAKRYFDVLVDTLIIQPVEAFTKTSRRRLVQHPRYYFFDVGVLNGCLNILKRLRIESETCLSIFFFS
jgi:predicted AAA+ superfamily ATPase